MKIQFNAKKCFYQFIIWWCRAGWDVERDSFAGSSQSVPGHWGGWETSGFLRERRLKVGKLSRKKQGAIFNKHLVENFQLFLTMSIVVEINNENWITVSNILYEATT